MKQNFWAAIPLAMMLMSATPAALAQDDDDEDGADAGCALVGIGVGALVMEVMSMGGGDSGMGERIFFAMLAGGAGVVTNEVCHDVVDRASESFDETMGQLGIPITWGLYGIPSVVGPTDPGATPWCMSIDPFACQPFREPGNDQFSLYQSQLVDRVWDIAMHGLQSTMVGGTESNVSIMSAFSLSGSFEAAALVVDNSNGISSITSTIGND